MIAVAFDTPLALFALAALLPVIALFLLKRKRRDVPVSSTMLWQRALKETMARSPFRRPHEWLSLILILLALIAAVLASSGMRLGSGGSGRSLILVIDVSASMAAVSDGTSRMDVARGKAGEAIDALREGDKVTLIAAGETPRVLAHATGDLGQIRAVLGDIEALPVGCDMRTAMALAKAEAQGNAEIVVLSDFCVDPSDWGEVTDFGLAVTLVRCGEPEPNVGITHAAVSGDEGGVSLLARVGGTGSRTLSLFVDDKLADARELECDGDELAVVFRLDDAPDIAGEIRRLTLKLEPGDALTTDDVAHVAVGRSEPPRILHIGEPDPFIDRLQHVVPGLTVTNYAPGAEIRESAFDLAIVTSEVDSVPPAACEFYVGCTPPATEISVAGDIPQAELADWESTHPVLRGVGLDNLLFSKALQLTAPQRAVPLVRLRDGPLLLELHQDGRRIYTWACGLNDSNLVLRPAFPVLIRNLLGDAVHRVQGSTVACARDVFFTAPRVIEAEELAVTVQRPDDVLSEEVLLPGETLTRRGPHHLGFYTFLISDDPAASVGTGLYNKEETFAEVNEPELPEAQDVEVVAATAWSLARPIWKWLAVGAALLLLAELALWLFKNRRPGAQGVVSKARR